MMLLSPCPHKRVNVQYIFDLRLHIKANVLFLFDLRLWLGG